MSRKFKGTTPITQKLVPYIVPINKGCWKSYKRKACVCSLCCENISERCMPWKENKRSSACTLLPLGLMHPFISIKIESAPVDIVIAELLLPFLHTILIEMNAWSSVHPLEIFLMMIIILERKKTDQQTWLHATTVCIWYPLPHLPWICIMVSSFTDTHWRKNYTPRGK